MSSLVFLGLVCEVKEKHDRIRWKSETNWHWIVYMLFPADYNRTVIRSITLFSGEVLGAHKRENTNYQESSTLELLQISQKKETNKTKWTGKYQLPVGKRSEPGHLFSGVMKHCQRQCNSTTDNLHFFVMRLFGLFIMATRRQKMFLTCTKVLHQYIYPVSRK